MATLVLSAVGQSIGTAVGGSVLGVSSAALGQAAGALIGNGLEQKIIGTGSIAREGARIDRLRLMGASEGTAIKRVFGRVRVAGQVIWSSRFLENASTTTATTGTVNTSTGKGGRRQQQITQTTTTYSYSISLAVAVCEGTIDTIGRIWADGQEIEQDQYTIRIYNGAADQMPDAKIAALEGIENTPAYRGLAYVVFEDLPLGAFGNRVPQFSFEVVRSVADTQVNALANTINAVCLIPGTGEYALAKEPVYYRYGLGQTRAANINSPSGKTDFLTSAEALQDELPNCSAVSLVMSWFGNDLRCNHCQLKPKVEQTAYDGDTMAWQVCGVSRTRAETVLTDANRRPVYGGTPSDQSVIQSLQHFVQIGKRVMFYPFILMEIAADNRLPNPFSVGGVQPALPWRGRITNSIAYGQTGSTARTAVADAEVAAFFGQAKISDFVHQSGQIVYNGADEWSYRRFILHYAHLFALAGVKQGAFCIGSEMRGLTHIQGANNAFVAVQALQQLAADVRQIVGKQVKIGYAADWSEYFGYQPADGSGDRYFHLDPLWASADIDFIGIDNYMPLSDWRDGVGHKDAHWRSIYNVSYLRSNIEGGEGYDWYYQNAAARESQTRTLIKDTWLGEDWIYRYKDIRGWWQNQHFERVGGTRSTTPTAWQAESKPIWFTEIGCAAIDKASNQPNKFLDPKSSESGIPYYSGGGRDDSIQANFIRAIMGYWQDAAKNPVSSVYKAPMIDPHNIYVWAWDARPWPAFPNNLELWSDGLNYNRGHWLNGRVSGQSLAAVIAALCTESGLDAYDISGVYGNIRGYAIDHVESTRTSLQPLTLAYMLDVSEWGGKVQFKNRSGYANHALDGARFAVTDQTTGIERTRAPNTEIFGTVRLSFIEANGHYDIKTTESAMPGSDGSSVSQTELPLVLTRAEAQSICDRLLSESQAARVGARFALPLSYTHIAPGDVVSIPKVHASGQQTTELYRIDRIEDTTTRAIEAVAINNTVYQTADYVDDIPKIRPFVAASPVYPVFLDLPLLTGDEDPHSPYLAVTAHPWPGNVLVYSSSGTNNYRLNGITQAASVIGITETLLHRAKAGLWDRGNALQIKIANGQLLSSDPLDVLNGANFVAVGNETTGEWEIIQFVYADLIKPYTYVLRQMLRGQGGTDAIMPDVWPIGSTIVLLNGLPEQLSLPQSARGLERHYRIGPGSRVYTDPVYVQKQHTFNGVGLRPYSPVHIDIKRNQSNRDLIVSWIRRTRIDGDNWQSFDVPLGETNALFSVHLVRGDTTLRDTTTEKTEWIYSYGMQLADNVQNGDQIAIAQISDRFGPGPYTRITIND